MKWAASSMRRSAASAELACPCEVAGVRRDAGEGVESEDLDMGQVIAPGVGEDRASFCSASARGSSSVHGGQ